MAEVDRLYELPLEEFTAARNELAKRLGDASIKQLKKPTVPAWAVNQLAHRREVDVRRLLRAGEQLEQAQKNAVEGGDQQAFARARDAEREALRRLRSQAAEVLRAGGHPATEATLERVARTLHAGSATEQGRALLREGQLSEELEPQGFGALAGVRPAVPRARRSLPKGRLLARAVRARRARRQTRRAGKPMRQPQACATRNGTSTGFAAPPSVRPRRPTAFERKPRSSRSKNPSAKRRPGRRSGPGLFFENRTAEGSGVICIGPRQGRQDSNLQPPVLEVTGRGCGGARNRTVTYDRVRPDALASAQTGTKLGTKFAAPTPGERSGSRLQSLVEGGDAR